SEWLAGRVVAKDAVRLHLRAAYDLDVPPADIEIDIDAHGRPHAAGSWVARTGRAPAISISHSNGTAVAVAGGDDSRVGVGIDIETAVRSTSSFEDVAFNDDERVLADRLPELNRDEWLLRFWSAKEAAAKAFGLGLRDGPRAFVVRYVDVSTAIVRVEAGERTFSVYTTRDDELIGAFTAIEVAS